MTAPVGTILLFAGNLDDQVLANQLADAGWVALRGQTVNRTQYPLLFAQVVRICQGPAGDRAAQVYQPDPTSGSFILPDLRGDFLRAADGRNFCGEELDYLTARPVTTAFTTNNTGSHTHTAPIPNDWDDSGIIHAAGHDLTRANPSAPPLSQSAGSHSHSIAGGGDAESRPRNLSVEYLVKVG